MVGPRQPLLATKLSEMKKLLIHILVLMLPATIEAQQDSATSTTTSMPPFKMGTKQIVEQIAPGVISWNFKIPWRRRLSATSTGYSFGFNTAYAAGGLGSKTALENFLNPLSQIGTGYGTTVNIPASGPVQAASFPIVGSGLQGVAAVQPAIVPPAAYPEMHSATNQLPVVTNGMPNSASLPVPLAPISAEPVQDAVPGARMDNGVYDTGMTNFDNPSFHQTMALPSQPNTPHLDVLRPHSIASPSTQNGIYDTGLPFNTNTNPYAPSIQPSLQQMDFPVQPSPTYPSLLPPNSYPTAQTGNGMYGQLPSQLIPPASNNV